VSGVLDSVLADLAAEGDRLESLVVGLDDEGWRTSTPAAGWTVATQVAHLAWTDEVAVIAATDQAAWDDLVTEALKDPTGFVDTEAFRGAEADPPELLARWRSARTSLADTLRGTPAGQKLPWFGPPMSPTSMATARFMETWAHSLDVHHALGEEPERTDRIRHVAHIGVRTRDFAYLVHEREAPADEFRIELTAPSGDLWSYGPEDATQTIQGSAWDFCLLVTQRIHRQDTDLVARGRDANEWLSIAQAFAGAPGSGRAARGS
jgi:uncharacterized protein (TIGR03084 family)